MSNKTKGIIAILFAAVFGGAVGTITKIALVNIPPFHFSFLRFLIASILLLPLFLKKKPVFNKGIFKLILISFLATFNIIFFVLGIRLTTASSSQLLYAGTPLLAALLNFLIFKTKISLPRIISIAIGLLGVFIVILLPLIQKNTTHVGDLTGNLIIALGVMSWSVYAVLSKDFQKKYSPIVLTSMFCFISTIVFFILSFSELSTGYQWLMNLNAKSVSGLLYVSVIGTIGTYLLNQYAFKYSDAILGSLNLYLMPIIAYFTAFLLLGERLHTGLIIGTALVFISIALTSYTK